MSDLTSFLHELLVDESITEILILNSQEIWFEKNQSFLKYNNHFSSPSHYQNFIHQICDESGLQVNYEFPFADGHWRGFRIHLCSPPVCQETAVTLRKLKNNSLSLEDLYQKKWCSNEELSFLKKIVGEKKNLLIVGGTGSGKTTLINSLTHEALSDRIVFIEDTAELLLQNPYSHKLITRKDAQGLLPEISQADLVKQSLRMRPDRLVVGEIRGGEAKDLLMALSTGHQGSMASLHAGSPNEALLRLEMLVQIGSPQWSLLAIRRLIQLTIDFIILTTRSECGWKLKGVFKISSLEEFGFSTESVMS